MGGRQSNSQYQYTLESEDLVGSEPWAPQMLDKLKTLPQLRDVSTDQQVKGLRAQLVIDRDTASRLGIPTQAIDNTLYDAFGQRQVSTVFTQLNEYHLVMEVAPAVSGESRMLSRTSTCSSSSGTQVPLSAFTHFESLTTALAVNHQGQFPAITLSFNLAPGVALGDAVDAIQQAAREIGMPPVRSARAFRAQRKRFRLRSQTSRS